MDYLTKKKFTFTSAALSADTFGVVEFQGRERLSRCYEFQALLVSDNAEIDLAQVIANPATFTCHRMDGRTIEYHGIVPRFEQLHAVDRCAFYRVSLAPRLFWLSLSRHNQVFLDQSLPEIVEACLRDGGLTGQDYEFRLQGDYPALEYVCQYNESLLDFISRWLEREGIYYYFEQGTGREKVVFTDTRISHAAHPQGGAVSYAPPSGLETLQTEEMVRTFNCQCRLLPASVRVQDYNYRQPLLEVAGTADVDSGGRGQAYLYGEKSATPEDAKRLAQLYAEILLCRREVFEGEGTAPFLSPGYTFELSEHYRQSFNQSYLATEVRHEGSQAGYLTAGVSPGVDGGADHRVFYRNSFAAIPAGVQYRPERKTARPKVAGTLTARVDAAGSGQYAELDAQGRYKVVLPFDLSGRRDGKASAWFRMATPYAGSDHGMHFPLHKGTEVLLTFRDGDPDRPVIAAAVPNAETPSPVTVTNQTASEIRTGSGNRIQMEDAAGSERILLHAPAQSSFIRIGAPNDPSPEKPPEPKTSTTHWGIAEKTAGWLEMEARGENIAVIGESSDWVIGPRTELAAGGAVCATLGGSWAIHVPEKLTFVNFHQEVETEALEAEVEHTVLGLAEQHALFAGKQVVGEVQRTFVSQAQALSTQSEVILEKYEALAKQSRTSLSTLHTRGEALQTVGNQIQTAGTRMNTAGSEMITAGNHIQSVGTSMRQSGTTVGDTALLMETAGTVVENAGVIFEG